MTGYWRIRLYITPGGWASASALVGLRRACEDHLTGSCTREVVDFEEFEEQARGEGVSSPPCAVVVCPSPPRRLSGATWEPHLLARELYAFFESRLPG